MRTKISDNYFNESSFFIGIDCHKKNWTVTILGEEMEHKTMSQDPEPKVLASYLNRNFPGAQFKAVYEAGFHGFNSARELKELGLDCIVIHPADVPSSQKEKLQKTDKADSRKLAKMLRGNSLSAIHIPDPELEADRALVRQRFRLVKDLSRIKNRVKSLLYQFGIKVPDHFSNSQTRQWSNTYTNWLKEIVFEHQSLRQTFDNYIEMALLQRKQLLKVNKDLRKLSMSDNYKDNYLRLLSVPGIGPIAAITFLLQIGDIKRFKHFDELCSYIGLVPSMHGSGDKLTTGKLIKRGRKEFKITLIEASWIAIRKDPVLMAKFMELSRKMNKNKAIIRIARKLLSRIRYLLMNQENYELGIVK